MNCYLDSSVVIRILFGEPYPLSEWKKIKKGFSSRLLRIECFRTIDRMRFLANLSNEEAARRLTGLNEILTHIGLLSLTQKVQDRAEKPFFAPVGSLDGLHLATALLWKETSGEDFLFATHDSQLGLAAKAHGFEVVGMKVGREGKFWDAD